MEISFKVLAGKKRATDKVEGVAVKSSEFLEKSKVVPWRSIYSSIRTSNKLWSVTAYSS